MKLHGGLEEILATRQFPSMSIQLDSEGYAKRNIQPYAGRMDAETERKTAWVYEQMRLDEKKRGLRKGKSKKKMRSMQGGTIKVRGELGD